MRIQIRGVTYESVKEAAAALGVTIAGVYTALDRGRIDKLGLGKTRPKKTVIGGIAFRSASDAARALGFGRSYFKDKHQGKLAKARMGAAVARLIENQEKSDDSN
jgi:hypothetical protein